MVIIGNLMDARNQKLFFNKERERGTNQQTNQNNQGHSTNKNQKQQGHSKMTNMRGEEKRKKPALRMGMTREAEHKKWDISNRRVEDIQKRSLSNVQDLRESIYSSV